MKKKLAILVVILLAGSGLTWAILRSHHQSTATPEQQSTAKSTPSQPTVPGGQTIINGQNITSNTDTDSSPDASNTSQQQATANSPIRNRQDTLSSQTRVQTPRSRQSPPPHRPQSNGSSVASSLNSTSSTTQTPGSVSQPSESTPPARPDRVDPDSNTNQLSPSNSDSSSSSPNPSNNSHSSDNNSSSNPHQSNNPNNDSSSDSTNSSPTQPNQSQPDPPAPKPPLDDKTKAQKLIASLSSSINNNVAQFTNDDNQIRTVLWTKGITAPNLNKNGDFKRLNTNTVGGRFVEYYAPFSNKFLTSGWYDVDKSDSGSTSQNDQNLCFAAVASNQLHWWLNHNKQRVDRFLTKTNYSQNLPVNLRNTFKDLTIYPNSFQNQQDSTIFNMFKSYFGSINGGYQVDPLIDLFINGYPPKLGGGTNSPGYDWPNDQTDQRGGFFKKVFDRQTLTQRMTTNPLMILTNNSSRPCKKAKMLASFMPLEATAMFMLSPLGVLNTILMVG